MTAAATPAATTFVGAPVHRFAVDTARRVIEGVIAPYGVPSVVARRADGSDVSVTFATGSLIPPAELSRLKLLRDHEPARAVGVATVLEDRPSGPWARFSVAPGPAGDEALTLAKAGVLDGLSVGVDYGSDDFSDDPNAKQSRIVHRADLREVSLCAMPAFSDARVTRVAASKGARMPDSAAAATSPEGTEPATEPAAASPAAARFTVEELGGLRELFASPSSSGDAPRHVPDPTRPLPDGTAKPDPWEGFTRGTLPPLMPNRAQVAELARAVTERRPLFVATEPEPADTFATITTTQTGRTKDYVQRGAVMQAPRIAELVGLTVEDVGWGGQLGFPIFGAGAASLPGEGAAKAEYAAITAGTATPGTIAAWTDMTGQVQSIDGFEAKLRNKLARLIAIAENEHFRAVVAGTAGIGTQAFVAGDQAAHILRAAAAIQGTNGVTPDLMLFNPADTLAIFGTAVSNVTPQELAELSIAVFGMVGMPMATQPAGFVLVGAWRAASTVALGNRLTYFLDPYTQAKSNVTTIIAEEAMTLAVEEPTGFTSVDIVV